jgi:putative inorganic carbon (HCO3(-)) transporter
MNSTWQKFVLSDLSLHRWRGGSYLYRSIGLLSSWRTGSWLLQWADTIGAVLIALVLVLAPFVSTSLIGVLLVAAGGYWIILTLSDDSKPKVTPVHLLVLLYWCVMLVSVAFSPVKEAATNGFIEQTLYLFLFALAARVLRSPRITSWLMTILLHVALVVSAYGVRQEFFGVEQLATWNDPTSVLAQDTRVYSYLGNPNLLAGYLLAPIALSIAAFFVWRGWLPKALAVTMFLVNSACLYFTDSRGGWLAMAVLVLTFLLLVRFWYREYLPRFWRVWLLPIVFGSLIALVIVATIAVEPLRLRLFSIFAGRDDSSNNFRINVWTAVFKMIEARPLIGIGPGHDAFNKVYPLYMVSPQYSALSSYSIFLETAVETGLIGLGCFLWTTVVAFDRGFRHLGRSCSLGSDRGFWLMAAIAAIAGMLIQGFADTVWYRPQINTLWWLMMAIIASQYSSEQRDSVDRSAQMDLF